MKELRRPLSAYNLFYRFKRSKVIEAHERDRASEEAVDVARLLLAAPGLEERAAATAPAASPERARRLRRTAIRAVLRGNLFPADTTSRAHRKSHGCGFVEMNKLVCASWKAIDRDAKAVFEELAEEGRRVHKRRVAEYLEHSQDSSKGKKATSTSPIAAPKNEPLAKTLRAADTEPSSKDITLECSMARAESSVVSTPKAANEANSRPKQSLSAYNLFYRFKRSKILDSQRSGTSSKDTAVRLIAALPGLEDSPATPPRPFPTHVNSRRRADIEASLRNSLFPNRTTSGIHRTCRVSGMSHMEVNTLASDSWKTIDDFAKAIFTEMAEEGRRVYRQRVAEYEETPSFASGKKTISSIRSCLERITDHSPLSSGLFDPIHIWPSERAGVDEFASRAASDYFAPVDARCSSEHAGERYTHERRQYESDVSADDFMKLISILNDNLCD